MTVKEIKEFIDKHTKGNYIHYDTIDFRRLYNAMLEIKLMLDKLDDNWVDVRDRLPKGNFVCAVMVEGGRFNGSEFEDDVDLLPYWVAYNYEDDYWVDIDGIVLPTEVIAWKKVEPYKREE